MTPPRVLWSPSATARTTTNLGRFTTFCEQRHDRSFDGYEDLWRWSTGAGLEACWRAVWDFFDVRSSTPVDDVLVDRTMPGASWFPGARLNYAEHALRSTDERPDEVAVVGLSQSRDRIELTWAELRDQVRRTRFGLQRLGVGRGDRVAAYLPNSPETIVAFLATASLGAIWTSCAPEFGVQAVLDRFGQVEPAVLLAIDGYRYGRHRVDRSSEVAAIRAGLPTVRHTVIVAHLDETVTLAPGLSSWTDLQADVPVDASLAFEQVPTDHPLYVLFSSGTTGLPKAIVHGHGGILLEHLKALGLHGDMGESDRFFWFTTTGWMMWNYLVSGLLVGARLVLFDGDPNHDGPQTLWQLAADEHLTWFGVGAPFIAACRRAGLRPADTLDLSSLRAVGSTGAPLSSDGFRWVYEAVSPSVMLSPISGGTDICSAFVGGSPLTPVIEGEIPCRYLGAAVAAFDESGNSLVDEQGELVVTEPMPSMPVGFWGDVDGSAYRAAYFEQYPGVWRHGDWITITARGSCVITGRSDATLNRGGVRVGTAEIYRVVESVDGVTDSLVVHLESTGRDEPDLLVLFVVVEPGAATADLDQRLRDAIRTRISPRHVPDEIHVVDVIPTTLSGKKLEIPVKKMLLGAPAGDVASRESLRDPAALDAIERIVEQRRA